MREKNQGEAEIKSEKVKLLCETRWVERHTALEDFNEMYEAIIECLTAISHNEDHVWDAKAMTEGNGLLCSITSAQFIAAFQVNREVFAYTKGLSQLLQGSSEDVVRAYEEVKTVKDALSGLRREAEPQYNRIFKTSNNMAEVAGTTMTIPRRCGRQNKRNNIVSK